MALRILAALTTAAAFLLFIQGGIEASPREDDATTIRTPGRAVTVREGLAPADAERGGLLILQFRSEPDERDLEKLRARGVRLGGYLGNGAYWARADAGSALAGLRFVRAAFRPAAADKITPPMARRITLLPPGEAVAITVSFFPGTPMERASGLLEDVGATALDGDMLLGARLRASLPAGTVGRLAASELVRAVEPLGRSRRALNSTAASRSGIDLARDRFGLSGAGVAVGVWDEGKVDNHPDLAGRLTIAQKAAKSDHATHVAGTIAGSGAGRAQATGMAYGARIVSYDFEGDIPTEISAAARVYKISLSNNSWGYINGWDYNCDKERWEWRTDFWFGHYDSEAAAFDELVYTKGVIIVFSAGNDRSDTGTTGTYYDADLEQEQDTPYHPPDGPYRTVDSTGSAKNVIAVGATTSQDAMTGFSSWGPTKDGRIKPEVTADGNRLLSTYLNGGYTTYSGTSMSAPVVTGGIALLIEQLRGTTGEAPAAVVRALIAATAKDLGNVGPDYSFGFGLLNVAAAAEVISEDAEHNTIVESKLKKAKSKRTRYYRFRIRKGTRFLRVALAWIDPPAAPDASLTLVNDLDLRLYRVKNSGQIASERLPWTLDGENPSAPAVRGINDVDNIELVTVDDPLRGEWLIEVHANLFGMYRRQRFALVVYTSRPISGAVEESGAP